MYLGDRSVLAGGNSTFYPGGACAALIGGCVWEAVDCEGQNRGPETASGTWQHWDSRTEHLMTAGQTRLGPGAQVAAVEARPCPNVWGCVGTKLNGTARKTQWLEPEVVAGPLAAGESCRSEVLALGPHRCQVNFWLEDLRKPLSAL